MNQPLIAIVGPTASGKSKLAMEVARSHNGEIICADSRTIYRGMDVGTAKPSAADRAEIRHHLLDVVTPDRRYSAVQFQQAAQAAIEDIRARGKLPILVGGTGLYIDAVLYNFEFPPNTTAGDRAVLEQLSTVELQARVDNLGVKLNASDYRNRHRLIRGIETAGQKRSRRPLSQNTLIVGLELTADQQTQRLTQRTALMLKSGWQQEVESLLLKYAASDPGLSGVGYRSISKLLREEITFKQASEEIVAESLSLAKRQLTWFKRNQDINWFNNLSDARVAIDAFVAKAV